MAELKKLLGFMSSWDREATLDRYEAMFDEGGDPEAVMERLGSPTKVAVDLAQDYISSRPPGETIEQDEPEIEVISLEQLLAEEDEDIPLAPPLPVEVVESWTPPPEEEIEAPPAPAFEEMPPELSPEVPPAYKPSAPKSPAPGPLEPETAGGGALLVLYYVLAVLIGLPVALVLFCTGVPFMVSGVVITARTVGTVPGLFASFTLLSDVLLVAGASLVRLALGLLLAWLGAWLSLTLCRLWIFRLILPLGRSIRNGKGGAE